MDHMHKLDTEYFKTNYMITIRCKLAEEIFWKQQGCCVTQISYNRIISISVWALYISSTHSHFYQRW